jgi:hypothetical protein
MAFVILEHSALTYVRLSRYISVYLFIRFGFNICYNKSKRVLKIYNIKFIFLRLNINKLFLKNYNKNIF